MNKNILKPFLIMGLGAIAVIIVGITLFKTSENIKQTQKAVANANELIGKPLPAIQFPDKDGRSYDLSSFKGKNMVLFFNEGIGCYPACWDQMASFGTDPRFNSEDSVAFSVVTDTPQDWQTAFAKMPDLAKAIILFDSGASASHHTVPTDTVSYRLGMLSMGSSMHTGIMPGHTYIMVDKQGIVRDVYDDPNMAMNNDKLFEMISKY